MNLTKQDKEIINNNLEHWMTKEYVQGLFWIKKRSAVLKYVKETLISNFERKNK